MEEVLVEAVGQDHGGEEAGQVEAAPGAAREGQERGRGPGGQAGAVLHLPDQIQHIALQ